MTTTIKYNKYTSVTTEHEMEVNLPFFFRVYDGVGMIAEDLTCKRITTSKIDELREGGEVDSWTISVDEWDDSFHHFLSPRNEIPKKEYDRVLSKFWKTAQSLSILG